MLAAACGGSGGPGQGARSDRIAGSPPLRIALAEHGGDSPLDAQIRATQAKVHEEPTQPRLEALAALFINKARVSGDAGFYTQAEACADAMPTTTDGGCSARLVRGHVRHALHDFAGAEQIARELVAARGMFLDHGLLGDVLLDQGRLAEARTVYQRMLDQKPCLQSYSRAAQVRWLVGDAAGCRQLLGDAVAAGSSRDPESLAWVQTRLAALDLQANDLDGAIRAADAALALVADYPQALFLRGRAALAQGRHPAAIASLAAAAAHCPLPEHLWAYAEALAAAGREGEARVVEDQLLGSGEREDPRSFALWLATTERDVGRALRLAEAEFAVRQDAFTLDALAFTRLRVGDVAGARSAIQQALGVGVVDARVLLHAALVEHAGGDPQLARQHLECARQHASALLPSELQLLDDLGNRL